MDFVGDDGCNKYFKYDDELCVGNDTDCQGNALVDINSVPSAIIIPDYFNGKPVVKIGKFAYTQHIEITYVSLGNNVRIIGYYAFGDLPNIRTINIPSSVEYIYGAGISFWNKTSSSKAVSLTQVLFSPNSNIKVIDSSVFAN